ncbi:MAG: hypothetical protein HY231_05875 [Acidobacteria bacterium]|nr:hypothetical protein [Acidobacteriota bacterium]
MDFSNYFYPENLLALRVIALIWMLAGAWLVGLLLHGLWLRQQRKQMLQCENVRPLVASLKDWMVEKTKSGEASSQPTLEIVKGMFQQFCKYRSLKQSALIPKHIQAIYEAGVEDGRLDAGELIKHTTNKLFQWHGILRSVLALFIVLGLLGTLFGLADSLAQLSHLAPGGAQQSKDLLSQDLANLLSHLKSAFAPSILGIICTIGGVILFSLYLNLVCAPIKHTLEHLTLTVWIPQLFPTTSQKLLGTLALSEEQIQKNLESVRDVAKFSTAIQNEAGELQQSVKDASQSLKQLTKASAQIKEFADKFVEGVGALLPFQSDLQALYKQMTGESESFQQSVKENIKNTESFQQSARAVFDEQNHQIKELLTGLKSYESAFIASRHTLDEDLQKVLQAADNAFQGIEARNQEVIEALGAPLREELRKHLSEIKEGLNDNLETVAETLKVGLKEVQSGLAKFDTPIKTAADHISSSLENFDKRTDIVAKELQREMREQMENNHAQLNHLEKTNTQIAGLLQVLAQSNQVFQATGKDLGNLSQNFAIFGTSILEFGKALNFSGSYLQQMKGLEETNKQMVVALKELGLVSKGQSDLVQAVVRKINVIEKEVETIGRRVNQPRQAYSGDGYTPRPTGTPVYQTKSANSQSLVPPPVQTGETPRPYTTTVGRKETFAEEEVSFGRRVLDKVTFWRRK